MGLLGWIKSRNAANQPSVANKSQEPKPENARQLYAREAAQEKTEIRSMDRMPPDQLAKVDKIKATLEKATQHTDRKTQAPSPAPADSSGGHEAVRQNMTGQDKTAQALSPTSAQSGKTAQENSPARSKEPPAKTQDKAQSRPGTVPRPRASWER
jgi:hypothetical protein